MEALISWLVGYGYLVVFGAVFAEQVGVPLPSIPILLAAGALAGSEQLSFPLVLLLAVTASVTADFIWYWIGGWKGPTVLGWLCRLSLEPDSCVRSTQDMFARRGAATLLYAKWIPGINTVAPPLAGLLQMRPARFAGYDAAGALLWVTPFVLLGYLFSRQLEQMAHWAARAGTLAGVLIFAALFVYLLFKFVQRQRFIRTLRVSRISPDELHARMQAGEELVIIDLRHSVDFEADAVTLPGALRMTPEEIEERHSEIPRDGEVILFCT